MSTKEDSREMIERSRVSGETGMWYRGEWYLRESYLRFALDAGFSQDQVRAAFNTLKRVFDAEWMRTKGSEVLMYSTDGTPLFRSAHPISRVLSMGPCAMFTEAIQLGLQIKTWEEAGQGDAADSLCARLRCTDDSNITGAWFELELGQRLIHRGFALTYEVQGDPSRSYTVDFGLRGAKGNVLLELKTLNRSRRAATQAIGSEIDMEYEAKRVFTNPVRRSKHKFGNATGILAVRAWTDFWRTTGMETVVRRLARCKKSCAHISAIVLTFSYFNGSSLHVRNSVRVGRNPYVPTTAAQEDILKVLLEMNSE